MEQPIYRGVVKGETVILRESRVPLPDGTEVLVTPLALQAGTAVALIAAMDAEPHPTAQDVAELEKAIAAGRRPLGRVNLFAEESGEKGTS